MPNSVTQTALSAAVVLPLLRSTCPVRLLLQRPAHRSATARVLVTVQRAVVQVHNEALTVTCCHTLLAYRARLTAILVAMVTALYNAARLRMKDIGL